MVRIITDSSADYEPQELLEKDILCIPMQISFGEDTYRENENLTKDEFYNLLETHEEFPKTAQPTPYEFETYMQEYKDNGDGCVVITISSALSGTYQSAVMTKNMVEYEDCYIIDSLNATGGQRILVDLAVKLRDEGKSAKEIAETLESLKDRVTLMACIDTLEYLYKGGRLSKAAYTVGSMVNIKPVIEVSQEGKVEVRSKTLNIRQGIRIICDAIAKRKPDPNYPIYVIYSHNRRNGDILAKTMNDRGYEVSENNIFNIGGTIGAHVGKNACGYIYIAE